MLRLGAMTRVCEAARRIRAGLLVDDLAEGHASEDLRHAELHLVPDLRAGDEHDKVRDPAQPISLAPHVLDLGLVHFPFLNGSGGRPEARTELRHFLLPPSPVGSQSVRILWTIFNGMGRGSDFIDENGTKLCVPSSRLPWNADVVIILDRRRPETHRKDEEDDADDEDDEPDRGDAPIHPAERLVCAPANRDSEEVVEPRTDGDAGSARKHEEDARIEQKPLAATAKPPFFLRLGMELGDLKDLPTLRALRCFLVDGGPATRALIDFDRHRGNRR